MHKPLGILGSSVDSTKLASTITGTLIACASLIVLVAGHLGFPLTVEQVTTFAGELGTAVGAIIAVFGVCRKVLLAVHTKFATDTTQTSTV